jgi:hypothetical protein
MSGATFRLMVRNVHPVCLFELSWGQGQQMTAKLHYPASLTQYYQNWQRTYLNFYKNTSMPALPQEKVHGISELRGRAISAGTAIPVVTDWHSQLVTAEAQFLNEFHRWLRSGELFEIRTAIAQASQSVTNPNVNVFLTCAGEYQTDWIDLARLPWEAWEIGMNFPGTGRIRIVRTTANIPEPPAVDRSGRARILAILGDDTGLDFHHDRRAVQALSRAAEITFVGWQPGQEIIQVKEQIKRAIADEQGWDVLFFAGHSNETAITGGELGIAPGASIFIHEIASQLKQAKERGLQVAIFNSCSGLSIAEALINLGFSQVAVMREPIHNRVAQEFLVQFLRSLVQHKNIQESLLAACEFLRLEKNFTYPSAYLVPSLFCHPGAALFRIQPSGWKQHLRSLLPTRLEAIALTLSLSLSLIPQVQNFLLDQRILLQAAYREASHQLPAPVTPPILLVQVDEESISRDPRLETPNPINRAYLANLVNRLSGYKPRVIGIDYLLNRRSPTHESVLRTAIQSTVQQNLDCIR